MKDFRDNLSMGNYPPTTVIDCAGAMLTQDVIDQLLQMIQEQPLRATEPIDIRIQRVSMRAIPKISVEYQQEIER